MFKMKGVRLIMHELYVVTRMPFCTTTRHDIFRSKCMEPVYACNMVSAAISIVIINVRHICVTYVNIQQLNINSKH